MQVTYRSPALLLALLLLPTMPLLSQTGAPAATHSANLITLNVTVDSKAGKPVAGLSAADFKVLDDKKPQPIVSFRALAGPQARTEVILVLDALNLPYTRVSYAREQISRFLSTNDGHLAQPTTLAVLLDTGMKIQPTFSTDGNVLRKSLDNYTIGLRDLPNSTGYYGALERFQISLNTIETLVDHVAALPGRKLLLWVSPGWPLLSGPAIELTSAQSHMMFDGVVRLSTEMREGQITVDDINPIGTSEDVGMLTYYESFLQGIRSFKEIQAGDLSLQVLAVESGGRVLDGSNDITGLLQRCFDQTGAVYQISIAAAPGEHDNEYHRLQVQIAQRGLTALTSTGYYARPVAAQGSKQGTPSKPNRFKPNR